MSTILPVGLTYLLPSTGTSLTLTNTDIITPTGKVGPLVLKLTNSDSANVAVVSYDNNFVPTPPPGPRTYQVTAINRIPPYTSSTITFNCNINTATATAQNPVPQDQIISSEGFIPLNGQYGASFVVLGTDIGGTSPANDLTYACTTKDEAGNPIELTYLNGIIPSQSPSQAIVPTEGNPTKVFTIAPLASELVQIPSSSDGITTLVASGSDVYVTPVQIIA